MLLLVRKAITNTTNDKKRDIVGTLGRKPTKLNVSNTMYLGTLLLSVLITW